MLIYNPQEKDAWYVLFTRRKKTRDVLFFIPQDKEVYCALILRAGKGQEVCSYLWFSHPMHFPQSFLFQKRIKLSEHFPSSGFFTQSGLEPSTGASTWVRFKETVFRVFYPRQFHGLQIGLKSILKYGTDFAEVFVSKVKILYLTPEFHFYKKDHSDLSLETCGNKSL